MVITTTNNNDPLPDAVEHLIDRKLRLMRRQIEMRLGGVKTEMGRAVRAHVLNELDTRKSRAGIHLSTLAAYREAVVALSEITSEWPAPSGTQSNRFSIGVGLPRVTATR